jgi:hypothetical protein
MKTRYVIPALFVLAAISVGAFFLVRWLGKSPGVGKPHIPGTAIVRQPKEVPAVNFTDVTGTSGIRFKHENGATPQKLLPETMGGGVAVLDFDGDGKQDLLFINGRKWPSATKDSAAPPTMKLYRNKGAFTFEDATTGSGLDVPMFGMGVTVGDIDNDGRPDVFISCIGKHHLFRNVDGKKFEDVTDVAKVGGPRDLPADSSGDFTKVKEPIPFGSSCTFLDYDGDGRLDLFVCHYVTWSPAIDLSIHSTLTGATRTYQQPQQMEGSQCSLYRNIDGRKFEDVSEAAGIVVTSKEGTDAKDRKRAVGKGLGVVICDPDNDGWPDIVVANDTVRNFFFHNEAAAGGGRAFNEIGGTTGAAYADEGRPRGGMGIDWGEFAAGRSSLIVANFANEPVTFLEKDSRGLLFSDTTMSVGLLGPSRLPLKFGTFFFDYDNDGRLDLLVANGHIEPDIAKIQKSQEYAQPAQLYWNTGNPDCYYEPVTAKNAGDDLFKPMVGRGSAFADFDGDGDLDVVLVANGGEARILRNDAPKTNHWARLDFRGDGVKSNRSAIGATVVIEAGGRTMQRQISGGRGYLSQSELVLTVGLGEATKIDKLTVRWPGRAAESQTWTALEAGKTHVLNQGN